MVSISRRNFLIFTLGSCASLIYKKINLDKGIVKNSSLPNLKNKKIDHFLKNEKSNIINPPSTDSGTLPNLRFSFKDSHIRKSSGGWTRQVTKRELGVATTIAGVNMRLNKGGIRELHWHKEAEWAYMLYGKAKITALDINGKWYITDVVEGDIWYFPSGIPHSIQGIGNDGCEFLLVFDNGNFDEDSTFLLSDWFKHVPLDVLSKNFNVSEVTFKSLPDPESKYIFSGIIDNFSNNIPMQNNQRSNFKFSYKMKKGNILNMSGGSVYITDSSIFKESKNISAALVDLKPGSLRELHWHPNNDEWQYYISGQGRMGVFASSGQSRTFDFKSGDVGYVPFAMGHYIENTSSENLIFLEIFKSSYYADISLCQWLANTPSGLVKQHLNFSQDFLRSLETKKSPIKNA